MIKWLLKNTAEFRLETMDDVEIFHKQLQKDCEYENYSLTNFSWSEKTVKAGGEELETYYVVKFTYLFNSAKDPEFPYNGVAFKKTEFAPQIENSESSDELEDF